MNEIDYKSILATTASFCTIIQFLSGIVTCQKIVKNKSSGDLTSFPFVSGSLSTSLWLRYGFLIQDRSIILVNAVGILLFFTYVTIFFIYSIKKGSIIRQCLACMIVLSLVLLHIQQTTDIQEAKSFLGLVCCFVTVLFFASPLSSLLEVIRLKTTENLPYHLILMTFIVSFQWLVYGIVLHDKFIQIPNFLGCILSGSQLSLFVLYPSRHSKRFLFTGSIHAMKFDIL
ncbi:sugar transporter SWEET1 [Cylas formicarius]|uniref:sugar transporter SWEET1 n=1 Tax=Cylas formicarius TaxID=197179 RepID=UPI002958BAE4|nr:sugar transporter SWEET1 [Cylas formicarius]